MSIAPGLMVRAEPVDIGQGYSVEFTFDGQRAECAWLPRLPEAKVGRQLLPAYYRARNAFFEILAAELGASITVIDIAEPAT